MSATDPDPHAPAAVAPPPRRLSSDAPGVLRGVDWELAFPFTRLFGTARVAAGPSKLLLALAAVLIVYAAGRLLDAAWRLGPDRASALATVNEVELWDRAPDRAAFAVARAEADAVGRARGLAEGAAVRDRLAARATAGRALPDREDYTVAQARRGVAELRRLDLDAAQKRYDASPKADDDRVRLADARASAREAALRSSEALAGVTVRGPFDTFLDYQLGAIDRLAQATLRLDVLGPNGALAALRGLVLSGPGWALARHPVFALVMLAVALATWAVLGGAISRICAVQVARGEKISVRSALRFSAHKFLSFVAAPLLPLLLVAAVGALLAAAGLLLNVPALGPIVVGAGFGLALLGGVLIAISAVGMVGGFGLMYPTIAAEGSDAFDAISRSFSYLYLRPWRLIFLSLVALVYGALTYLALRVFLFVALTAAGAFARLLVFRRAPDGRNALDALYPPPASPWELSYKLDDPGMGWATTLGAVLAASWVYLLLGLLAAYVLSWFVAANTHIYFLMRREVDAEEYDAVHLDEDDALPAFDEPPEPADDDVAGNPVPPPPPSGARVVATGAPVVVRSEPIALDEARRLMSAGEVEPSSMSTTPVTSPSESEAAKPAPAPPDAPEASHATATPSGTPGTIAANEDSPARGDDPTTQD